VIARRSSLRHLFIEIPGALTSQPCSRGRSCASTWIRRAPPQCGDSKPRSILARLPRLVHRNGGGSPHPLDALSLPRGDAQQMARAAVACEGRASSVSSTARLTRASPGRSRSVTSGARDAWRLSQAGMRWAPRRRSGIARRESAGVPSALGAGLWGGLRRSDV